MSHRRYTPEFKDEAVRQVTEKGHSVQEVAARWRETWSKSVPGGPISAVQGGFDAGPTQGIRSGTPSHTAECLSFEPTLSPEARSAV